MRVVSSVLMTLAGIIGGVIGIIFSAVAGLLAWLVRLVTGGAIAGVIFCGLGILRDGWHPTSWVTIGFEKCAIVVVIGAALWWTADEVVQFVFHRPANPR